MCQYLGLHIAQRDFFHGKIMNSMYSNLFYIQELKETYHDNDKHYTVASRLRTSHVC